MPVITKPNQHFDVTTYTGNGTGQSITNSGSMQPDFVWVKSRTQATSNYVYDSIRGAGYRMATNLTVTEALISGVTSFDSNGFTLGTETGNNNNADNYVAWQWKAGGTAVTNTSGSISSQVSVNTTAGFSIVTYTGTGSNATVGHGLGVAPSFIIAKARNSAQRWTVYTGALGNGYYGYLNETFAFDTANASLRWNTSPTSSVFGVGTSVDVNNNTTTYVAYCFAQVAGYSAFGSYTGNGSSDGTFIYLGFRPKFFMIKDASSGTLNWYMWDSARNIYNVIGEELYPSLSNAGSTNTDMDFLSNGIKLRNSGGGVNNSGDTFIYAAFAEAPFKFSNAR